MYRSLVDEVRLCIAQVQARSLLSVQQFAAEQQEIHKHVEEGNSEADVTCLDGHLERAGERLV
jgi:hypothetical protein